jgi:hypothetical protein
MADTWDELTDAELVLCLARGIVHYAGNVSITSCGICGWPAPRMHHIKCPARIAQQILNERGEEHELRDLN